MKKYLKKSFVLVFLTSLAIIAFSFLLYKIYIPRASSFGCFDDCFNFMGGYFLLNGKSLYSEIFFNHSPGMAYISALIQSAVSPINLYDLVLKHRQFVLLYSLVFNLILFWRFRYKVLGFILIFELTKFYVFGDRFLAEGLIVYTLVYLAGLAFENLSKIKIRKYDYVLTPIFAWFAIFLREPYVPLAVFLFTAVIFNKNLSKIKIYPILILIGLSIATILYHNFSDFYFNVFTVNQVFLSEGSMLENVLEGFFYPIWSLLPGENSLFHEILIVLCLPFLLMTGILLRRKRYAIVGFVWLSLLLANFRPTVPGLSFFAAFHMIIWYGLFIFFSFSMLTLIKNVKLHYGLLGFYILAFVMIFWPGRSFIYDKVNQNTDFVTNYGVPLQVGDVVAILSDSDDTLFLDGYDDIIYWVSKRQSSYPYSWYTSLMPGQKLYTDSRLEMFREYPPDFYYGSCIVNDAPQRIIPDFIKNEYIRLEDSGEPSCLWVKKSKEKEITDDKWQKVSEKYYSLPKNP